MTITNNPAGRLHAILSSTIRGDQGLRMLDVWAIAFQLLEVTDVEVVRRLIAMSELLDEVKRLIESNPDINHQRYLGWVPAVKDAIAPLYLQSNRGSVITPNITPEVLTRLEFCDEELRRYYTEEEITQEELSAIVKAVNDLFEMVDTSVQNPTLRLVLLDGLEKVRIAIALYRIHGAKGLKSSLQNLLGIVFTEHESVIAEKAENSDVITRLGDLLDKLDSFSAKALKIHKAFTKPVHLLLSFLSKEEEKPAVQEDSDAIET